MITGHPSDVGLVARGEYKADNRQHREPTATHSSNGRIDHRMSAEPTTM